MMRFLSLTFRFLPAGALFFAVSCLTFASPLTAHAQEDPRVADVMRRGEVRVGLHLPQLVQDQTTGEIRGNGTGAVIEQIARSLAERLNVKLRLIGHPSPPAPIECLKAEECDVGFLGFLQHRASDVGFSPPYIMVPFTFMVPAGSSIHTIEDVDNAGIRIAAVRNHASSLALSRIRK